MSCGISLGAIASGASTSTSEIADSQPASHSGTVASASPMNMASNVDSGAQHAGSDRDTKAAASGPPANMRSSGWRARRSAATRCSFRRFQL